MEAVIQDGLVGGCRLLPGEVRDLASYDSGKYPGRRPRILGTPDPWMVFERYGLFGHHDRDRVSSTWRTVSLAAGLEHTIGLLPGVRRRTPRHDREESEEGPPSGPSGKRRSGSAECTGPPVILQQQRWER